MSLRHGRLDGPSSLPQTPKLDGTRFHPPCLPKPLFARAGLSFIFAYRVAYGAKCRRQPERSSRYALSVHDGLELGWPKGRFALDFDPQLSHREMGYRLAHQKPPRRGSNALAHGTLQSANERKSV